MSQIDARRITSLLIVHKFSSKVKISRWLGFKQPAFTEAELQMHRSLLSHDMIMLVKSLLWCNPLQFHGTPKSILHLWYSHCFSGNGNKQTYIDWQEAMVWRSWKAGSGEKWWEVKGLNLRHVEFISEIGCSWHDSRNTRGFRFRGESLFFLTVCWIHNNPTFEDWLLGTDLAHWWRARVSVS